MSCLRRLSIVFCLGCLGVFGGTVLLEVLGNMPACILCHVERAFFLGVGLIVAVGCFLKDKMLSLVLKSVAVIWFAGAGVALYHTAVQYHLIPQPRFCAVQEPQGETLEEMAYNLMHTRHAPCNRVTLSFLGIPMPVYLVFLMTCLGVLCWNMKEVACLMARFKKSPKA